MSLTSYRAAPPRVKPCILGPAGTGPHAGAWDSRARAAPRDAAYVAIALRLGKSAVQFYRDCSGHSECGETLDFERFRGCGPAEAGPSHHHQPCGRPRRPKRARLTAWAVGSP